jgi:hypothetical protein
MFTAKIAQGITLEEIEDGIDCDDCIVGRQTMKSFRGSLATAKVIRDMIHSDMCGPFTHSLTGAR